jgi:hypothetical protein
MTEPEPEDQVLIARSLQAVRLQAQASEAVQEDSIEEVSPELSDPRAVQPEQVRWPLKRLRRLYTPEPAPQPEQMGEPHFRCPYTCTSVCTSARSAMPWADAQVKVCRHLPVCLSRSPE